tara:strand:- start:3074 stop:4036 length:963 start_codon:yes stop_codon:yes gene_type:complete
MATRIPFTQDEVIDLLGIGNRPDAPEIASNLVQSLGQSTSPDIQRPFRTDPIDIIKKFSPSETIGQYSPLQVGRFPENFIGQAIGLRNLARTISEGKPLPSQDDLTAPASPMAPLPATKEAANSMAANLPSYDTKSIFDVNDQSSGFNPNLKMNAETLMKQPFMETISSAAKEEGKKPEKERGAFYKGLVRLGGTGGVNQGLKEFASIISDAFFGDRGVQAGIEARELARVEAQPDDIDAGEFIRLQEAQVLQALQAAPGKNIQEKLQSLSPYQQDVYNNYVKKSGGTLDEIFQMLASSNNNANSRDEVTIGNYTISTGG